MTYCQLTNGHTYSSKLFLPLLTHSCIKITANNDQIWIIICPNLLQLVYKTFLESTATYCEARVSYNTFTTKAYKISCTNKNDIKTFTVLDISFKILCFSVLWIPVKLVFHLSIICTGVWRILGGIRVSYGNWVICCVSCMERGVPAEIPVALLYCIKIMLLKMKKTVLWKCR